MKPLKAMKSCEEMSRIAMKVKKALEGMKALQVLKMPDALKVLQVMKATTATKALETSKVLKGTKALQNTKVTNPGMEMDGMMTMAGKTNNGKVLNLRTKQSMHVGWQEGSW